MAYPNKGQPATANGPVVVVRKPTPQDVRAALLQKLQAKMQSPKPKERP